MLKVVDYLISTSLTYVKPTWHKLRDEALRAKFLYFVEFPTISPWHKEIKNFINDFANKVGSEEGKVKVPLWFDKSFPINMPKWDFSESVQKVLRIYKDTKSGQYLPGEKPLNDTEKSLKLLRESLGVS